MKRSFFFAALAMASAAMPSAAWAKGDAATGFRIGVIVPEVCEIEASVLVIESESGGASGSVFEMCNSRRGFRVVASHRPLVEGEAVTFSYAGETGQLDSSGVSTVAYRSGPIIRNVPISVQSDGLIEGLSISLGMTII